MKFIKTDDGFVNVKCIARIETLEYRPGVAQIWLKDCGLLSWVYASISDINSAGIGVRLPGGH